MRTEAFVFGNVVGLLLTTGVAHGAGPTRTELNNAANDGTNWPYVDHDYGGERYTPLRQITREERRGSRPGLQCHLS